MPPPKFLQASKEPKAMEKLPQSKAIGKKGQANQAESDKNSKKKQREAAKNKKDNDDV